MTFMTRLKTSASDLARHAVGAAFGVALTAALVGSLPTTALAQTPAAAASTPAPRAEGNGPALWVVRDADSTLYLFGTVHVLRPTTAWGSDTVDAAFDSASRLILEVANPDDQAAAMPLIMQYGISPETPLSSLLTANELAALDVAAKSIGLSAAQMDPMRPWLAALTLSVAPLTKAGYDPTSGVDLLLKARAEALTVSNHRTYSSSRTTEYLGTTVVPKYSAVKHRISCPYHRAPPCRTAIHARSLSFSSTLPCRYRPPSSVFGSSRRV